MEEGDLLVKITHFINPNRFYCCLLSNVEKSAALQALEQTYSSRCDGPRRNGEEPKIDDVSFLHLAL